MHTASVFLFFFYDLCNVMLDEWHVDLKYVAVDDKYKRLTLFISPIVIRLLQMKPYKCSVIMT